MNKNLINKKKKKSISSYHKWMDKSKKYIG